MWWRVMGLFLGALLALQGCGGSVGSNGAANLARLASLTVTGGELEPPFSPDRSSYTVRVPRGVTSVRVVPEGENVLAKIRVNGQKVGSGKASPDIPLVMGDNEITVEVTSLNEVNHRVYHITVRRVDADVLDDSGNRPGAGSGGSGGTGGSGAGQGGATDATLAALSLSATALDPEFRPARHEYTAAVGFLVTELRVTASPAAAGASLRLNGQPLTAGQPSAPIALAEGTNRIEVEVTAPDGQTRQTYVVTVTRLTAGDFARRAVLRADPPEAGADFGYSVALDGDRLAVGAPRADGGQGAVYLFRRVGGAWQQSARLAAPAGSEGNFGYSVALDGDRLAVGAPAVALRTSGSAYVFEYDGGAWQPRAQLYPPLLTYAYGYNVALQGDRLAVANLREQSLPGTELVDVFQRTGSGWERVQTLYGYAAGDRYGHSLLMRGDELFVGSFGLDDECRSPAGGPGTVVVFRWDGAGYRKVQDLGAAHGDASDRFGFSLSLDGDTLAVGAPCEDSASLADPTDNSATQAGMVYLFRRAGDFWTPAGRLKAATTSAHDLFGQRVALRGDTLVATALLEDAAAHEAGAAYVFRRSGDQWREVQRLLPGSAHEKDCFGVSLAFRGGLLAVGAEQEAGYCASPGVDPAFRNGALYLFE